MSLGQNYSSVVVVTVGCDSLCSPVGIVEKKEGVEVLILLCGVSVSFVGVHLVSGGVVDNRNKSV